MAAHIVLITGGNTGIGLKTVEALYSSSKAYSIILSGRSLEKAQNAVKSVQAGNSSSKSSVTALQLDIEDDESISKAVAKIQSDFGKLDTLINNAGGAFDGEHLKGNISMRDLWNKSWNLNVTSTQVLTHQLVPLLLKSSEPRILFLTSGTSPLAESTNTDLHYNKPSEKGWPKQPGFAIAAYRSSKCGLNMMMREWCKTLGNDGVKCFAISPGFLATGLGGVGEERLKNMGAGDASVGGEFIRKVVEGERDQDEGKAIRDDGIQPW